MAPASGSVSHPDPGLLGQRLLQWYEPKRRALPWRNTRNPYAIWVAEVMLQQTRTETVIPYYERFLTRFPTVASLANAPLSEVLKAWEGLGYYARARNLHAAAQRLTLEQGGQVPDDVEALLRLPGVGAYTAAAIASIAFGQDVIALDGNLRRVLCRVFGIDDDPGRPNTQARLIGLAHEMLPPGFAGELNQALMDLGAGTCLPAHPRCLICPLVGLCEAQGEGIQELLPIRATRKTRPHRDVTAGVIRDPEGRFLITQRPLDAMLGGLWEFPGGKRRPGEELADCLKREIGEELEIEIEVGRLLCTVEHGFTHFQMTLYAFDCRWLAGLPKCIGCTNWQWVTLDDLDQFAFPVADQRVIAFLRDGAGQSSPD
ncbi:MAG TPA: A/G-specific adenine glycosylase [Anaerolineae bacterium]|nr:A/G-specific adenine glycosylase [Anaerolineae bacterium]